MQISAFEKFVVVAGELQNEDSQIWALLKAKPALYSLLNPVPMLAFSPTGVTNTARRFHITGAELEGCIVALLNENLRQSRPECATTDMHQVIKPTTELLAAIGKAVAPKRKKAPKKAKTVGEGRANG